jgi:hypothetical protein
MWGTCATVGSVTFPLTEWWREGEPLRNEGIARAGALQLKLISNPARHTPAFPAYEALLKARHHARTYLPDAHARAEEYCKQAIAFDPKTRRPMRFWVSSISFQRRTRAGRCRRSRPSFAAKHAGL